MSNWDDFLDTADQFFISYSLEAPFLIPVKLFEIGHTIELYLKAANTKLTGNIEKAISFRHNIKDIWDDCKTLDATFMPNYEIKDSIFNSNFISEQGMSLSQVDQVHYFKNQELYLIARYLPDIKYLGAPLKSIKTGGSIWLIDYQNPYWIAFLKEIRRYLGYPLPNHRDWIKICITENRIPRSASAYLRNLYK